MFMVLLALAVVVAGVLVVIYFSLNAAGCGVCISVLQVKVDVFLVSVSGMDYADRAVWKYVFCDVDLDRCCKDCDF
jgi:hypothetical protein